MSLTEVSAGRDAALRRPRPERSGGRNERGKTHIFGGSFPSPDATLGDGDSAARCPYRHFLQRHNPTTLVIISINPVVGFRRPKRSSRAQPLPATQALDIFRSPSPHEHCRARRRNRSVHAKRYHQLNFSVLLFERAGLDQGAQSELGTSLFQCMTHLVIPLVNLFQGKGRWGEAIQ